MKVNTEILFQRKKPILTGMTQIGIQDYLLYRTVYVQPICFSLIYFPLWK